MHILDYNERSSQTLPIQPIAQRLEIVKIEGTKSNIHNNDVLIRVNKRLSINYQEKKRLNSVKY